MDFASPRFSGNPVLEEILNDPDTGTKKLTKGSPSEAVRAVQRALLDLHWVDLFFTTSGGAQSVITQFLDGDYGPWTTATVLAYKRNYNIHFPPSAPMGLVDGFAGPGTLKWLDKHCVLLDEASAAIAVHAEALLSSGAVMSLEFSPPDGVGRSTRPIRQSAGASRSALIDGAVGDLVYKRGLGAFELHGPIFVTWVKAELAVGSGNATGAVGFPISNVFQSDAVTVVEVERGSISHNQSTGEEAIEVRPGASVLRQDIEF